MSLVETWNKDKTLPLTILQILHIKFKLPLPLLLLHTFPNHFIYLNKSPPKKGTYLIFHFILLTSFQNSYPWLSTTKKSQPQKNLLENDFSLGYHLDEESSPYDYQQDFNLGTLFNLVKINKGDRFYYPSDPWSDQIIPFGSFDYLEANNIFNMTNQLTQNFSSIFQTHTTWPKLRVVTSPFPLRIGMSWAKLSNSPQINHPGPLQCPKSPFKNFPLSRSPRWNFPSV